ncbi:MAG TPA: VOC family protein [Actinomycetota bacterium]|nr:VOC family protein [Actinomycetota bacterium]
MSHHSHAAGVYPALSYRDPAAALDWLESAFGFERLMEARMPDGNLVHAEMKLGNGVIMLGPSHPQMGWTSPLDLPAVNQSVYVVVDDPDSHCAQARGAGAEIVREPNDTPYGSREYGVKDLEGHIWSFGTYVPQLTPSGEVAAVSS